MTKLGCSPLRVVLLLLVALALASTEALGRSKCAKYGRDRRGRPKWPLFQNRRGRCRPCSDCPYSEGWEGCTTTGRCQKCRAKDGYRLDVSGKQCVCRVEDGWRMEGGRCVNTPCPNPFMCTVSPCFTQGIFCPLNTQCFDDYCGACRHHCIPDKSKCPKPVRCSASPCSPDSCPKGFECAEDYCHGACGFRCLPKKNRSCPQPVACLVSPCSVNADACKPGTTCEDDTCHGSCDYKCVPEKESACPHQVNCLVSPCLLNANKCSEGTRCQEDYCHGGCNYKCV